MLVSFNSRNSEKLGVVWKIKHRGIKTPRHQDSKSAALFSDLVPWCLLD
jgi:hypothetical protein